MIHIPLLTIVAGLMTVSIRLTGLMLFAPFFGGAVIPARIKAGLVLALTLLLFVVATVANILFLGVENRVRSHGT